MSWYSAIATTVILTVGIASLTAGTSGWSTWTAEGARRAAVLESPQPLPVYLLRDTKDQSLSLSKLERSLTVVDLIYTRCPTVCLAMGAQFRQLQSELATAGLLDEVQLLSITFDPDNDDRQALADYLKRFGAVEPHWRAARFESDNDLASALQHLGVVVIPEPTVGFVHNAAFYLIENGQVIEIFDIDDRTALFEAIRTRATT